MTLYREKRYEVKVSRTVLKTSQYWKQFRLSLTLQGLCCKLFQQAKTQMKSNVRFWERFRAYFFTFKLPDWVTLYQAICSLPIIELPVFDTS